MQIKLDSTGHVVAGEWDETKVYSKYHTAEKLAEAQLSAGNSLTTLVESPDGELEVRLVMGLTATQQLRWRFWASMLLRWKL